MTWRKLLLAACLAMLAAGCKPKTLYNWNEYDDKLYKHYKNPADNQTFVIQLKEIVADAEASGKVPPGIYAEYGFALYEMGESAEAVRYFKLESDKWPESRVLMAKMIKNAEQRGSKSKEAKERTAVQEQAKPAVTELQGGGR